MTQADTMNNKKDTPVKMRLLVYVNAAGGNVDLYRKRDAEIGAVERSLIDDFENSGRLVTNIIDSRAYTDDYAIEIGNKVLAQCYAKYKKIPCPDDLFSMKPLSIDTLSELTTWRDAFVGWEACFMTPPACDGKVEYDTKIYYRKLGQ
jgi:hypothetical protein